MIFEIVAVIRGAGSTKLPPVLLPVPLNNRSPRLRFLEITTRTHTEYRF